MEQAIEKAKAAAGGAVGLAKAISNLTGERISPQAVSQWKATPAMRVLAVEKITGISRHELRPDLFGASTPEAAP
jgi:DNA-binding transcriptional regulator YdaS (Cro superfamily)